MCVRVAFSVEFRDLVNCHRNPAVDWPWSSAQVHLGRIAQDGLTAAEPVASRYPNFADLIAAGEDEAFSMRLRRAESVGRPLGSDAFLRALESQSGRVLKPGKPGRAPRNISALSP